MDRNSILKPYLGTTWDRAFKLVGDDDSEFLSDFCLVRDYENKWHCIGIGGQGHIQDSFFHAVGNSLDNKFSYIERVYSHREKMEWMWAPFIMKTKKNFVSYLYYCHRECGFYQMRILVSETPDMKEWKPAEISALEDGNIAFLQKDERDPCIFYDNTVNKFLMYYSAASGNEEYSKIFVRSSEDLIHWSKEKLIMDIPEGFTAAESPFVHKKDGVYYLFVSGFDYGRVAVYASFTPFDFGDAVKDKITELNGHAPEIVSEKGKEYIVCAAINTKTGDPPGISNLSGVYIQELLWK